MDGRSQPHNPLHNRRAWTSSWWRDLVFVRVLGRPYGRPDDRWARDGWTPSVALGPHGVPKEKNT